MKSQIHELMQNKLFSVSKKVVMLVMLVLGTAAFANVKPIAVKGKATKEISIRKHKKAIRKAKRVEMAKAQAPQAKK